jgi:signal recognition particle subunit SRP72
MLDARKGSEGIYERAYSLYRLQRESEAQQVLSNEKASGPDDRAIQHLDAQLVRWFIGM